MLCVPVFFISWLLISHVNILLELKGVLDHVSDLQMLLVCCCEL